MDNILKLIKSNISNINTASNNKQLLFDILLFSEPYAFILNSATKVTDAIRGKCRKGELVSFCLEQVSDIFDDFVIENDLNEISIKDFFLDLGFINIEGEFRINIKRKTKLFIFEFPKQVKKKVTSESDLNLNLNLNFNDVKDCVKASVELNKFYIEKQKIEKEINRLEEELQPYQNELQKIDFFINEYTKTIQKFTFKKRKENEEKRKFFFFIYNNTN